MTPTIGNDYFTPFLLTQSCLSFRAEKAILAHSGRS